MVNLPGRDRRRRVLKDDVLSASYSNHHADSARSASDAPRYSDAASVENHPQITDFIPRRYATIITLVAIGVGSTVGLAALNHFAPSIASAIGMSDASALELSAAGSFAAWVSAVVLMLASALSMITYSIRRHRIDDFKGRYRVWMLASFVCLVASANSVVGLHQVAADAMSYLTGWSMLRDGAVWWVVLAGLPVAWIMTRALLDTRECRVAAFLLTAAVACYVVSAASYLGLARIADPRTRSIAVGSTLLMGHWFTLAAIVSYARFVVLDAQGLITVRRRTEAKKVSKRVKTDLDTVPTTSTAASTTKPAVNVFTAAGLTRPSFPQAAKTPADSKHWVDGSRPERENYDDDEDDDSPDGTQKLSKSDRKRLRKLKAQGRAA